jgi:hypothetical protein
MIVGDEEQYKDTGEEYNSWLVADGSQEDGRRREPQRARRTLR